MDLGNYKDIHEIKLRLQTWTTSLETFLMVSVCIFMQVK